MDYFNAVFKKFDECMQLFDKAMAHAFNKIDSDIKPGAKLKIKKNSVVYIGQGIYAKLENDVKAVVTECHKSTK
jgi:hypothetical protein